MKIQPIGAKQLNFISGKNYGSSCALIFQGQTKPFKKQALREYYDSEIQKYKKCLNLCLDIYGVNQALEFSWKLRVISTNRLLGPSEINFIPAKTLNEAKNYSARVLGVTLFDIVGLDTANFINGALVKLYNLSGGNIFMPKAIRVIPIKDDDEKGLYQKDTNQITLSSDYFSDDYIISDEKTYSALSEAQKRQYEEYERVLSKIIFHEMGHCNWYGAQTLKIKDEMLKKYSTQQEEARKEILYYMDKINEYQDKKDALNSPFDNLYKLADKFLKRFQRPKNETEQNQVSNEDYSQVREIEPFWEEKEEEIARKVSSYAAENRDEFIAETFAQMCLEGFSSIPFDALELYRSYEGPIFEKLTNMQA